MQPLKRSTNQCQIFRYNFTRICVVRRSWTVWQPHATTNIKNLLFDIDHIPCILTGKRMGIPHARQEIACSTTAWIFGNSSVRVGTQGLFRPYLKTFVPPFLPTRLTATRSPRMVYSIIEWISVSILNRLLVLLLKWIIKKHHAYNK